MVWKAASGGTGTSAHLRHAMTLRLVGGMTGTIIVE
jgi:hypothetical protein